MKQTYIETVLSHIRDKRAKQAARHELTDHWLEKEQWYTELGYDAQTAARLTEEDLGDPDVAGEQFAAADRQKPPWLCIGLILGIAGIFAGSILTVQTQSFFIEYFSGVAVTAMLTVLFLAAWRRQMLRTTCFAAFLLVVCVVIFGYLLNTATFLLHGYDGTYEFFYSRDAETGAVTDGTFYYFNDGVIDDPADDIDAEDPLPDDMLRTLLFLKKSVTAALLLCTAAAVILMLRTRALRNTKAEYYIGIGVRVCFCVMMSALVAVGIWQTARAAALGVDLEQQAAQNLRAENARALETIETYRKAGALPEAIESQTSYVQLHAENGALSTRVPRLQGLTKPVTPFSSDVFKAAEAFAANGTYLEDAPMTCEMTYTFAADQVTLFYPDGEADKTAYLLFSDQNGRFVLTGTNLAKTRAVTLSAAQRKAYDAALRAYLRNTVYAGVFRRFPDAKLKTELDVFDVRYDPHLQTYEICQALVPVIYTQKNGAWYIVDCFDGWYDDRPKLNRLTHVVFDADGTCRVTGWLGFADSSDAPVTGSFLETSDNREIYCCFTAAAQKKAEKIGYHFFDAETAANKFTEKTCEGRIVRDWNAPSETYRYADFYRPLHRQYDEGEGT